MRSVSNTLLAVFCGVLTGALSSWAIEPVSDLRLSIPGLPSDAFPIATPLSIAAGVPFGLLGALFVWRVLRFTLPQVLLFSVLSIVGMFAAAEAATWAFLIPLPPFDESFFLAYLAASPIGALILAGPMMLWRRGAGALQTLWRAVAWPTGAALLVAFTMVAMGSDDALNLPWSAALFCSWQALFLYAFAQRPHIPLG
ncbi:hypothetical protein V8J82_03925 [Gymnodinialimonas sp. 2305UL16-5]|uniref:hypothetical protein n=1 Tax=Gymnodinialimonas mytili TaxID=3126503 RepID=UPI0030B249BE